MKKLILVWIGISLVVMFQQIFAAGSIFPIDQYTKSVREFTGYTTFGQLQKLIFIKKSPCTIFQENDASYLISPACLVQQGFTGMEVDKALNLITPFIHDMNVVYNTSASQFIYQSTSPIFTKKFLPSQFTDDLDISFLASLQKQGTNIRISDVQLAYMTSKSWSRYAVWKDMTALKPCTKQNYYVAFNLLDNYILASGAQLNLNDILAYRGGYCKGTGPKDLMFYGGVCGAATQLFRLSLLIPGIDIVDRYEHSIWYVPYYSEYVYGDDAALYQKSKKLVLQNNSPYPIYIRTIDFGQSTYLIGIVPQHTTSYVEITKEQTSDLSSKVTKKVYSNTKNLIKNQEFLSNYVKKSYTVN